jgi:hypothetical protein
MSQLVILAAAAMMILPATPDLSQYLPPNGTPPGWARDGQPAVYTAASAAGKVTNASELAGNGMKEAIVQFYRKGTKEVKVEIFDMGSANNAESAFSAMTKGKSVEGDLGKGNILEPTLIIFYNNKYCVAISADEKSEEISQTMAALAMTVDAYLF